jgi:hypothetical protein
VIAASAWDGQITLADAVRRQLGNTCDVLAFTPDGFPGLRESGEPAERSDRSVLLIDV